MYYAYSIREVKISRTLALRCLAISLILFVFPTASFAISREIAEEYRQEGVRAQRSGNLDMALSFYQKAVQIDSQYAPAFNDLGVAYELRELLDAAEQCYLRTIECDPNYLPAYYNLAALYEKKGKSLLAFYYWKQRIEKGLAGEYWTEQARANVNDLARKSADVRTELARMKAREFSQKIIEEKRKEFENRLVSAQEHLKLGQKLCSEKEYLKAIDEFNIALKFAPDMPEILEARQNAMKELITDKIDRHYDTARKLFEIGDYSDARAEIEKALTLIPEASK
jgi:tetratricopeptide (TPR) repeat protein